MKELSDWDFPDTTWEPEGYDMKEVPTLSARNFIVLIEAHNELVRAFNERFTNVAD